jgi:hypothetical protein
MPEVGVAGASVAAAVILGRAAGESRGSLSGEAAVGKSANATGVLGSPPLGRG